MGEELEVQIINSPYMTLGVDLRSIVEKIEGLVSQEVKRYMDDFDWQDLFTDHSQTISEIANEDLDVHDAVHDIVNDMGFVRTDDLDVEEEVVDGVRSQLRQFNRLDSLSEACTFGEAFIEAIQRVANVSRVDMQMREELDLQQALNNQFKNATIKLEFSSEPF